MATRDATADDRVVRTQDRHVTRDETKPSFLTTEFYAMVRDRRNLGCGSAG
jgi:hypothetical protein